MFHVSCFMFQMFQRHGSARSGGAIRSAFNEAVGGTLNTNTSAIGAGIVKGLLKLATASSLRPPDRDKLRTALGEGGKNLAFIKLSVANEAQAPRSRGSAQSHRSPLGFSTFGLRVHNG
jgi:hypothetical protein